MYTLVYAHSCSVIFYIYYIILRATHKTMSASARAQEIRSDRAQYTILRDGGGTTPRQKPTGPTDTRARFNNIYRGSAF